MEIHYKIIGALLIFLAAIHLFFPRYFEWKVQLQSLSLINRQMMTVHTFFIAFAVFLTGLLCLLCATELVNTNLGKTMSLGLGIFWAVRLFFQLFIYSRDLWRGRKLETTIHVLFTVLWIYFSTVFIWTSIS
jgi:hypothetical protein